MLSLSGDALAAHDANRPTGPHRTRCYAPFTSMYFDQFGNVLACCINTTVPMGSYPRQRVADIWAGIAAKNLRDALGPVTLNPQVVAATGGTAGGSRFDESAIVALGLLPAPVQHEGDRAVRTLSGGATFAADEARGVAPAIEEKYRLLIPAEPLRHPRGLPRRHARRRHGEPHLAALAPRPADADQ